MCGGGVGVHAATDVGEEQRFKNKIKIVGGGRSSGRSPVTGGQCVLST